MTISTLQWGSEHFWIALPKKTVQICCDMKKGRLLHVPAVFSCLKSFVAMCSRDSMQMIENSLES